MSLHEYHAAQKLTRDDTPFHALIMAAMLRADSHNTTVLRVAFPDQWDEVNARYHSPGGILEEDRT